MQVLYMLGDIAAGPAFRITQWLQLVRERTSKYRSSGFPHRLSTMPSFRFVTYYSTFNPASIALFHEINFDVMLKSFVPSTNQISSYV